MQRRQHRAAFGIFGGNSLNGSDEYVPQPNLAAVFYELCSLHPNREALLKISEKARAIRWWAGPPACHHAHRRGRRTRSSQSCVTVLPCTMQQ
jgi:hypothetical protein